MDLNFVQRTKYSARRFSRHLIMVAVLVMISQTACNGNAASTSNSTVKGAGTNLPLIKQDLDLTKVVLGPQDVSDLFAGASYSISQAITNPNSEGVTVTYPTQVMAHTTAFAEGFSTRVEIFNNIDEAIKSFDSILAKQSGEKLKMDVVGDESHAFKRPAMTPEGADLSSTEYAILFLQQNVVATIILRTEKNIPPTRLGQLAKLVVDRLQP